MNQALESLSMLVPMEPGFKPVCDIEFAGRKGGVNFYRVIINADPIPACDDPVIPGIVDHVL